MLTLDPNLPAWSGTLSIFVHAFYLQCQVVVYTSVSVCMWQPLPMHGLTFKSLLTEMISPQQYLYMYV